MAETLALEKLYNDVVARFTADSLDVSNVFGWSQRRHRGAQQNRICWEPGDPSGAAGSLIGAKRPGRNPRPIDTLEEIFTVYIEGRNLTSPENEQAQYKATMQLFMAWRRAVYLKPIDGNDRQLVKIKSMAWLVDQTVRRHGATLRAVCTVELMIPDSAYTALDSVDAAVDPQFDADRDDETENTSDTEIIVPPL